MSGCDARGRSIKCERVPDGERVQRYGAVTVGDATGAQAKYAGKAALKAAR